MREPLAVREGRDPVLAAVQEKDRGVHLRRVEPPRGDIGQLVVHLPVPAAFEGLPGDGAQPGPRALRSGLICHRELRLTAAALGGVSPCVRRS
ncbi:MAG TPA: hypothetical protein VHN16_00630 [Streptosporangiaceae bacterium]|nr:hypothetical protein [Streptosporangiaceae bacterium]